MLRRPHWLPRDTLGRRSSASLEFVLVLPVLILLFFGVYDISETVLVYQEVYNAAHTIAASASNLAVQADGSTSLTYPQAQLVESEIWGDLPTLRGYFQDGTKSVTLSSIVFEPTFTTATCQQSSASNPCYVPVVVWSVVYKGGDSGRSFQTSTYTTPTIYFNQTPTGAGTSYSTGNGVNTCGSTHQANSTGSYSCYSGVVQPTSGPMRNCVGLATSPVSSKIYGSLNQTTPITGSASDLTNLRTSNLTDVASTLAPPSPILLVDVNLTYTPPLGPFVTKTVSFASTSVNFWVNAYWPVRSVQATIAESTTPLTLYNQFTSLVLASAPTSRYDTWCTNNTLNGAYQ